MPEDVSVLVVGAGMGGVRAAARLAAAGQRPLLVERGPRVGGRASSFVKDGFVVNTGAVAIEMGGVMEETSGRSARSSCCASPSRRTSFASRVGRSTRPRAAGRCCSTRSRRRGPRCSPGSARPAAASTPPTS